MYLRIGKRLFDVSTSVIALVLLSPILAAVCVGILIGDPGPIVFRQERLGKNETPFVFYKFRSLPVGTANLPSDAIKPTGLPWIARFLRRTNVDELPQLFNVLRGEMSLVGPRPPLLDQLELIELRRRNGASCCHPGLTGLAQINSYDGMTVKEKAAYDGEYARSISFLGDVRILLSTIAYLRSPPPVY